MQDSSFYKIPYHETIIEIKTLAALFVINGDTHLISDWNVCCCIYQQ